MRIQDGVKNISRLIEDLLKLAQIGREERVRVTPDPNSLLKDVLADLQAGV